MTEEIRFRHLRFKQGGAVTIAWHNEYDLDSDIKHVSYALAFCSPKDSFNKKLGRIISKGRLSKITGNAEQVRGMEYYITTTPSIGFVTTDIENSSPKTVIKHIGENIQKFYKPRWFKKAFLGGAVNGQETIQTDRS